MRTVTFMSSVALAVWAAGPGQAQAQEQAQEQRAAGAPAAAACLAEPVVLKRFGLPEPQLVSLTDCAMRPNPAALPLVSALAAPPTKRDASTAGKGPGVETASGAEPQAEDVPEPLLNPQLLVLLQQVASRFPDRTIEIVSGYRTRARATSRHRSGDALDLRIEGVDNEELSIFARTLEQTGVGYYPNSTFVHIDVREASAYWVDRSAPGERPDYVRQPPGAAGSQEDAVLVGTEADDERDILSAQLARSLVDVHGPELPAYEEDRSAEQHDAAEPAGRAEAQPAEAQPAEAQPAAEPAPAEPAAAAQPEAQPAAAEPATAAPQAPEAVEPAQLDAEIQQLLERALVVMREANAAG